MKEGTTSSNVLVLQTIFFFLDFFRIRIQQGSEVEPHGGQLKMPMTPNYQSHRNFLAALSSASTHPLGN